jgi:hypothetical protein
VERKSVEFLRAVEAAEKLRIDVNDVEAMLTGIDGSRMTLETVLYEIRNQLTVIRERVNWVIRELDMHRAQLLATGLSR